MNDNLGLLLRTPGWQTKLILNRFRNAAQLSADEKKQEDGERYTSRQRTDEEKAEDHREYIETRLREVRAWERKISGK